MDHDDNCAHTHIPHESKKQDTLLLLITLPYVDHFQNSITTRLISKHLTKWSLKNPSHLIHVTLWN